MKKKTTILPLLLVLLLASCGKDEHFNTSHPDHGMLAVTANWAAR